MAKNTAFRSFFCPRVHTPTFFLSFLPSTTIMLNKRQQSTAPEPSSNAAAGKLFLHTLLFLV
jgi:hypothetical protein